MVGWAELVEELVELVEVVVGGGNCKLVELVDVDADMDVVADEAYEDAVVVEVVVVEVVLVVVVDWLPSVVAKEIFTSEDPLKSATKLYVPGVANGTLPAVKLNSCAFVQLSKQENKPYATTFVVEFVIDHAPFPLQFVVKDAVIACPGV